MAADWKRSGSGSRGGADKAGVTRWVNQTLSAGGYADIVTDLSDMGDGISLLKLVQSLAKDDFPKHSPAPMMRAEKLENLQICLGFLQEHHHVQLSGVQAEDFLAGKLEPILTACNAVRKHFSSHVQTSKGQRSLKYSTIEKEDVRVLMWLEELLGKEIKTYSTLYDGTILCELLNVIHNGAINDVDLDKSTSSVSRLKLVESAARKHLYITLSFDPLQVSSGRQDSNLRSFLQQCKQIYQQQQHRQGAAVTKAGAGKREAREAAQISARSYEGIQKKKAKDQSSREQLSSSGGANNKKYPDLYVQGASSFTDLSSRRAEHEHMIRGGGAVRSGINRHSSTSSESLDQDLFTPFGGLDRVHSMESGISQQQTVPWKVQTTEQSAPLHRSASQGNLPPIPPPSRPPLGKSLARSTENFGSVTTRRTPSYLQLSPTATEDLSDQLNGLEERVGVLASRFLYERRDMFKQILHALVKERRKRQLAERRIEALERSSRQLVQHYDKTLIVLAKQVAVLKSEVAIQKGDASPNSFVTEMEQLKEQVSILTQGHERKELSHHLSGPSDPLPPTAAAAQHNTLFLRKRGASEVAAKEETGSPSVAANVLAAYSKGSAASYKKLSRFFGEAPPRVEDLESFCEELGYTSLLPKLHAHNISLAELRTLTEEHLEAIGIPLGARVRLLEEVKNLEPIDGGKLRLRNQ